MTFVFPSSARVQYPEHRHLQTALILVCKFGFEFGMGHTPPHHHHTPTTNHTTYHPHTSPHPSPRTGRPPRLFQPVARRCISEVNVVLVIKATTVCLFMWEPPSRSSRGRENLDERLTLPPLPVLVSQFFFSFPPTIPPFSSDRQQNNFLLNHPLFLPSM